MNIKDQIVLYSKNKNLVEIYTSEEDKFSVGYILGLDNDYVIFQLVSVHGLFDGYRIQLISSIKTLIDSSKYLDRLKLLIKKNQLNINDIFNISINSNKKCLMKFLEQVNKHPVTISIKDDKESSWDGVIDYFDNNKVVIDLYGDEYILDYKDVFEYDEIESIDLLSEDNNLDEFLINLDYKEDIINKNDLYCIDMKEDDLIFDGYILSKDDKSILFFDINEYGIFNGFRYELLDSIDDIYITTDKNYLFRMNKLIAKNQTKYYNPFLNKNSDNNLLNILDYSKDKCILVFDNNGNIFEGYIIKLTKNVLYLKTMDEYNYYEKDVEISINNISTIVVDSLYTKDDDYLYKLMN